MTAAQAAARQLLTHMQQLDHQVQGATACITALHTYAHITKEMRLRRTDHTIGVNEASQRVINDAASAGQGRMDAWMADGAPAAAAFREANAALAASYGCLVRAAVESMARLDTVIESMHLRRDSNAIEAHGLFFTTWVCVYTASKWFSNWETYFQPRVTLSLTSLQPVMHSLMAWLLSLVTRGGSALRAVDATRSMLLL